MKVWELIERLQRWPQDEEVRVQIDGTDGIIEAVEYWAAHNEGFVVIRGTLVLVD